MIVNYNDFYFTNDDGYLALAHAPDPDGQGIEHLMYIEPGNTLAMVIAKAWSHQGAPQDVIDAAVGARLEVVPPDES